MSITFAIWPTRTPSLLMKPVGGPRRALPCSSLKMIFVKMASLRNSSLTPSLHSQQTGGQHLQLKIPSTHLGLQLLLHESLMKRATHFTSYGFTTPGFCIRPVCTAQLHRRPCCPNIFTNTAWKRVGTLCLHSFLVIPDKRGRSI